MNKLASFSNDADRSQLAADLLKQMGLDGKTLQAGDLTVRSPVDGLPLGKVNTSSEAAVDSTIAQSVHASRRWKTGTGSRRVSTLAGAGRAPAGWTLHNEHRPLAGGPGKKGIAAADVHVYGNALWLE